MAANGYVCVPNAKLDDINELPQSNIFNTASHVLIVTELAKHR